MIDKILQSKSVLFLGIGGVSMHQLAIALKKEGKTVVGYDAKESDYTKKLKEEGIVVNNRFVKKFTNVDICITTGAIKDTNKYIQELKTKNVPIIPRAELLAWFSKKFKNVIAVAGTHGKSTTSTLIYEILRASGKKVSCHIGADVFSPRFDVEDDYLVVEACEYQKSFLSLYPTISVVTNVEKEHMDCYRSIYNLRNAFLTFLKRAPVRFVFDELSTNFAKSVKDCEYVELNCDKRIIPKLHGEHNLKNISLALSVVKSLGVDDNLAIKVVNGFDGVPRRYEFIGTFNNSKFYIDYAHHPTEINAFITTFCKDYENNCIVFQPHTFSRTKMLLPEFLYVLKDVKNLIIYKEYPAREQSSAGMSAFELYKKLKEINPFVKFARKPKILVKMVDKSYDAVSFVGAGDIDKLAKMITYNKN